MSREIKFRAWDGSKLYDGDSIVAPLETMSPNPARPGTYRLNEYFRNHPELIFMQYTGLKDKNGKEIYEGDIVQTANKRQYQVKHGWFREHLSPSEVFNLYGWYLDSKPNEAGQVNLNEHLEVIGNIYENPELVK